MHYNNCTKIEKFNKGATMEIEIHYCTEWNFKPKAAGVAEELKKEFGSDANLIPGSGGVFDVVVDGKLVYSKFMQGRFPNPGEVAGKLKA